MPTIPTWFAPSTPHTGIKREIMNQFNQKKKGNRDSKRSYIIFSSIIASEFE
jgi:hypothetical protein